MARATKAAVEAPEPVEAGSEPTLRERYPHLSDQDIDKIEALIREGRGYKMRDDKDRVKQVEQAIELVINPPAPPKGDPKIEVPEVDSEIETA